MTESKGVTFGIHHPTVVPHDTREPDDTPDSAIEQGPTCYDD